MGLVVGFALEDARCLRHLTLACLLNKPTMIGNVELSTQYCYIPLMSSKRAKFVQANNLDGILAFLIVHSFIKLLKVCLNILVRDNI